MSAPSTESPSLFGLVRQGPSASLIEQEAELGRSI